MSCKTEYSYNDDDFIEQSGEMQELTVTITLCEYRNLIEERCYSEKAIEQLQEENERLKKHNDTYIKLIIQKYPAINDTVKIIADTFGADLLRLFETEINGDKGA